MNCWKLGNSLGLANFDLSPLSNPLAMLVAVVYCEALANGGVCETNHRVRIQLVVIFEITSLFWMSTSTIPGLWAKPGRVIAEPLPTPISAFRICSL